MITLDVMDTPLGPLSYAVRDGALCSMWFCPIEELEAQLSNPKSEQLTRGTDVAVRRALEAYFDGQITALDGLRVAPGGSAFEANVWRALREIPAGHTASYGELARKLGKPGASRAVGLANSRNPVAIVIPCHRVIRSDGALCGYAGGVERKRWLLTHEGAIERTLL